MIIRYTRSVRSIIDSYVLIDSEFESSGNFRGDYWIPFVQEYHSRKYSIAHIAKQLARAAHQLTSRNNIRLIILSYQIQCASTLLPAEALEELTKVRDERYHMLSMVK